jgi:hypothetical protein
MVVTENYQATLHTDRDLLNSVISWFLEGKRSLSHLSILDTISFSRGKETIAYFRTNTKIVNLVGAGQEKWRLEGNLCFRRTRCFFGPNKGPSYSSDRHGFNTAPCRFKARDGNWVVHYVRKQMLSQYVVRQADLSRISRALNESIRTQSSTWRREKKKMGPLEGALRITYRGNALDVCEEAWSLLCWVISWVTLSSIKYYLPEISFIPLTRFRFPHITVQFLHWGESRVLILLDILRKKVD